MFSTKEHLDHQTVSEFCENQPTLKSETVAHSRIWPDMVIYRRAMVVI
jgi:hypothetical protein